MAALRIIAAMHPALLTLSVASAVLTLLGLVAFNLGYVWLYVTLLPLLCLSTFLSIVEVSEDFLLSLLLLAVACTALYAVGIFALPLVACGILLSLPVVLLLRRWRVFVTPGALAREGHADMWTLELCGLLLLSLFARYLLYRGGGGAIPLRIGEFESLTRFLFSEVGGWVVFALGYGMQHHVRYGVLYSLETEFAASLPSLLATGLFLVTPHVAIMTLGLNIFGVTGLYIGSLPVGAAHLLLRTLTLRRLAIEQQNVRLQHMNAELARNERLAAIGEMSSAISHQLLQKVGLLRLQCSLLCDVLLDEAATAEARLSEGRERVEQLDDSITELNTTLSDLLIFSKDVSLQLDRRSLGPLLHEAVEEVRALAERRGVTIVCLVDDGTQPVSVDGIKLKQALLNVLTNAVEASPAQASITLALEEDAEQVRIRVSDSGPGIPEDKLEQIFSPFFSTKAQGTGLGLTFAQKIIALHGGRLTASNNIQGGATFIIDLPKRGVSHG
ncbi:MAG TPA: HAMP domain-containing sensor histidine kinase [Methylomirabilota bacterium]|jgi:signal transduction histidine kinase|nr:HAMP domain-containing sensor histidine kinase [Methylomirabilota bacterium]